MKIDMFKVIVVGNSDAAKAEFIKQVTRPHFHAGHASTLGADFSITEYQAGEREVHLYVWDLNGHPSFSSLRRYYLQGADIHAIVVDAGDPEDAGRAAGYLAEALGADPGAKVVLIAASGGLAAGRSATAKSVDELAAQLGIEAAFAVGASGEGYLDAIRGILSRADPSIDVSGLKAKA
ncbi:MAG: hypothetical protein JW839_19290 [Candidatus Lokiarchaeota archaeon]|nr:hypothetical protein [Candidatus Lokiarchaeota archaeon]